MSEVCNLICRGSEYHRVIVLVVLNSLLITGGAAWETAEETEQYIDVETASDDELKERLLEFGVHYSLESVLNVLEPEAREEEPVRLLLAKFYEEKLKVPQSIPPPLFRHPIISIDGFFTHGRTKVAKLVTAALHGRRMLLPTRHISRLRNYISSPELRKHYYSLSKYMGANMAIRYCRTAPVILERYWHDQTAYVIAKTFSGLIPDNSSVYDFPKDLLIPDLMFYVNGALNPKVHNESTEAHHVNNELSDRIVDVSRKLRPKPIEIGPPSLPTPMVKQILAIIDQVKFRFLPKPLQKPKWRNH